jgi:2'-5' RNA ligase
MAATSKYFLAWVPPEPVYSEAADLKSYFAATYGSKAALRSPPHITLHMPFLWKDQHEPFLLDALARFARQQPAVPLAIRGFGCFAPRVIFANVELTDAVRAYHSELQRFCRQHLQLFNAVYKDLPFHPHLTLAFRDLKKAAFADAWATFQHRAWEANFVADRLTLLKHDGYRWLVFREFLVA